jgi:DnaD/phage-associated family protein
MIRESGLALFTEAVRETIICGTWSLKYTEQILNRWARAGIRTIYEVEVARKQFEAKKAKFSRGNNQRK